VVSNATTVAGWTQVEPRIEMMVDATYQSYISFNPVGGANAGELAFGHSGATNINSTSEILRISSTNRVGVCNNNPSYTLDVSGNGRFTSDLTAASFTSSSDYRLKSDVQPLPESASVDGLKPVEYMLNGRKDMGFLAHELQEHFPFLVNGEKDGEQMQSVNYIGLIALLVKEVQDLKKKVQELSTM